MFDTFYDEVRREQIESDVYGGYDEQDSRTTFICDICGEEFHPGEGGYRFCDADVCEDCLYDYVKSESRTDTARNFIHKDEETEAEFLLEWFKSLCEEEKVDIIRKAFNEDFLYEDQAVADFCMDSTEFTDFVIEQLGGREV